MLPKSARLRRAEEFRAVVRGGIRVGRPSLVLHAGCDPQRLAVRVGLVVPKTVGGSVQRNRVKRRLRHLASHQLAGTPAGVDVVIRALPAASGAPDRLEPDLTAAWSKALRRLSDAT